MTVSIATLVLGVLGLFFGSFAGATVWRLRAAQLREDKKHGEKIKKREADEVKHIKYKSLAKDRSICLHCGHQLKWFDLIPLVSWVSLGGKCRYCHKKIGLLEPTIELAVAAFFVVSFIFWPYGFDSFWSVMQFICWLAAGVGLAVLFVYDAKWFLLPDRVMFVLLAIAVVFSVLTLVGQSHIWVQLMNIVLAATILSGIYYVIYVVSKHQWIGFGDVKLGLVLALLLADWRLATLALFLANAIGTLILLPMMLSGRIQRRAHIPFGPFLIAGWFLSGIFGVEIIEWYMLVTLGA